MEIAIGLLSQRSDRRHARYLFQERSSSPGRLMNRKPSLRFQAHCCEIRSLCKLSTSNDAPTGVVLQAHQLLDHHKPDMRYANARSGQAA
jgi:hypothetical protein